MGSEKRSRFCRETGGWCRRWRADRAPLHAGPLAEADAAARCGDCPPELDAIAFAAVLVALAALAATLLRAMAMRQRAAARQIEPSAWHLRQLVR